MNPRFEILFLEEARAFLGSLDVKTRTKLLYNMDKARYLNDPKLLKKLNAEIWEFRTRFNGLQYRLLAFWDKTNGPRTLVISTHGFVKKVDKISPAEINTAEELRKAYFTKIKK